MAGVGWRGGEKIQTTVIEQQLKKNKRNHYKKKVKCKLFNVEGRGLHDVACLSSLTISASFVITTTLLCRLQALSCY